MKNHDMTKKGNKKMWKQGIKNDKLISIATETKQRKGLILT